jgi:hypothetical protein
MNKKISFFLSIILGSLLIINIIGAIILYGNFWYFVFNFVNILSIILIIVYLLLPYANKIKQQVFQVLFVGLTLLFFITTLIVNLDLFRRGNNFFSLFYTLLSTFSFQTYFFLIIFSRTPESDQQNFSNNNVLIQNQSSVDKNIALNVILSIVTFGLYFYIWIYKIAFRIKEKKDDSQDPLVTVLLSIFIPFYTIYWIYKVSTLINDHYQKRNGGEAINVSLTVLISVFSLSLVSLVLIEDSLSTSVLKSNDGEPTFVKSNTPNSSKGSNDVFKQLELLSEIFKKGVISEQEYLSKKEDLLRRI